MNESHELDELIAPIQDDLTSGAAEIALQAIGVYRTLVNEQQAKSLDELQQLLVRIALSLVKAQPAMAPLFHLGNRVLLATQNSQNPAALITSCTEALDKFEQQLCDSAARIADIVFNLIPPGELVFAYSFSSTVVSSLLSARSQRKFFRAVCTEARPSMEGRKLASMLAAAGLEVIHTFDSAMGLVLPNCRVAFMGCDCVARPGLVNKVGSWLLALACRELSIPLYALAGTEKFITDDLLFSFEDYERPGHEVWTEAPSNVRVLNHQFELIPFSWIAGLVTEEGILKEKDIEQYTTKIETHPALSNLESLVIK